MLGFDAFRGAMDSLKKGDVVILGTPPAFRWVQFTYAIENGLHTFMEKPVTVDGPTTRRMFQLGEQAAAKNLKVGVGLMVRHCRARQELWQRIRNGEIGGHHRHARVSHGRRQRQPPGPSPKASASWLTRSSASTRSCGPAAASSATTTSTRSTNAVG